MRYLEIEGPCRLCGRLTVQGSKNSAVALLPAALLCDEPVMLKNVPAIRDVEVIRNIFADLGVSSRFHGSTAEIDPRTIRNAPVAGEKAGKYRASYYFMGALISRFRRVFVAFPGGDNFGSRPIDQHVKGFRALGIRVRESKEGYWLEAGTIRGNHIYFDTVTCGGTINVILAAAKAEGETVLHNAARDPEVVDLCNFLNRMGARIRGAGTDTIRIRGVDRLAGCTHRVIPDRLAAGTFLLAGIATDGHVRVDGIIPEHLRPLLGKLEEMGARYRLEDNAIEVEGKQDLKAVRVRTGMYPGFATDLQQPLTALMLRAQGKSIVTETVYPGRFAHVPQLRKMGAVIERRGETAFIEGGHPLVGTDVTATDVRAGICLMIAAFLAKGKTRIFGVEHVERGYGDIAGTFAALGARIRCREWDGERAEGQTG